VEGDCAGICHSRCRLSSNSWCDDDRFSNRRWTLSQATAARLEALAGVVRSQPPPRAVTTPPEPAGLSITVTKLKALTGVSKADLRRWLSCQLSRSRSPALSSSGAIWLGLRTARRPSRARLNRTAESKPAEGEQQPQNGEQRLYGRGAARGQAVDADRRGKASKVGVGGVMSGTVSLGFSSPEDGSPDFVYVKATHPPGLAASPRGPS
jgi:hypothetical protein